MDLTLFDVVLLVALGGFVMFGAWFGLFHTLGSLFGTVAGTFFGGIGISIVGPLMHAIFGDSQWVDVITFMVIFAVFSRLVGFGFYVLDKSFSIMTKLPFLSSADRILGAVVGFFEGILVIGMILYVASKYDLGYSATYALQSSTVAPWFVNVSWILQPLLPRAINELRSIIGI